MKIVAIVVTYNRKELLIQCINALLTQSRVPEKILIVNNASTDETLDYLQYRELDTHSTIDILTLPENIGGAGGFSAGLKYVLDHGADYIWMMDDDATPHSNALENLIRHTTPDCIYASLAVQDEQISWEMTVKEKNNWKVTHNPKDISQIMEVYCLPFLGFMIHRNIVEKIGLPDEGFFITADDTEYCLRAKNQGYKLYLIGDSLIEHPKAHHQKYKILGKTINYVSLPAWKRYYDTRNRIFISKKYFGLRLYSQTLPSLFFRFILTMIHDENKLKQLKAYFFGCYDGLMSRNGKRHENKGLQ